jgi:hypothetical protein
MKSMIKFTAVVSCCLLLGSALSCSERNEAKAFGNRSEKAAAAQKKATKENTPPIVVQQFMGCKAHR